ncbi:MAG: hypothetical protein MI924_16855 [Chloroflexales bacterium]|nr:hypothetical protein [Chloroflexales bacterium]
MNPRALAEYLDGLVRHNLKLSTMLWGLPGIGKSSIVAQTARAHNLEFIDVRLSQLAPPICAAYRRPKTAFRVGIRRSFCLVAEQGSSSSTS